MTETTCPICNTANPPEETSCTKCGFSLGLSRADWPTFPTIEMPEVAGKIQWPESQAPLPPVIPPAAPEQAPVSPGSGEIAPGPISSYGPPLSEDDRMARRHIDRGLEALRQGLDEQARWEFEQAGDLADDQDIATLAQQHLSELVTRAPAAPLPAVEAPPPQPAPAKARPSRAPRSKVRTTSRTRQRTTYRPMAKAAPDRASQFEAFPAGWEQTATLGAIVAMVGGLLAIVGATSCLGVGSMAAAGFGAGVLIANRDKAIRGCRRGDAFHAMVAGAITGLGCWIGHVVGADARIVTDGSSWTHLIWPACLAGVLHIPAAIGLSVAGWKAGTSQVS